MCNSENGTRTHVAAETYNYLQDVFVTSVSALCGTIIRELQLNFKMQLSVFRHSGAIIREFQLNFKMQLSVFRHSGAIIRKFQLKFKMHFLPVFRHSVVPSSTVVRPCV